MNPDAMVLALVAIADLAVIVHLRRRRGRRVTQERMMDNLRLAIHRSNVLGAIPHRPQLRRAS